jgi:hypothetical protein
MENIELTQTTTNTNPVSTTSMSELSPGDGTRGIVRVRLHDKRGELVSSQCFLMRVECLHPLGGIFYDKPCFDEYNRRRKQTAQSRASEKQKFEYHSIS